MKKHFYSLFAAVAMMLAVTSCSQEEDFAQSSSELTSFSISMDEVMGSRAIGDGLSATTLHYEVYHEDVRVIDSEETVESGKVNVELDLLNGEAYDIIFWAQAKDGSIYDVTDLKEIKVKYDNAENNKESYDAFYNALNGFEADGKTHKIELRRPFAQLNLGTTDWDAVKINGEGNPVTATSVTVKGLAETFAPLTGTATGSVEKTFAATKLSFTEEDDKFTVNSTEYKRLSLTYLLVPGTKAPQGEGDYTASDADGTDKALVDLTFNLKRGENDLQPIYVKDAPLQRNWRTNVIGALLTGSNFDVIIEEGLDNNHDVKGIDFDYLSTTMDADKDKEGDIVYSITGLGKESVDVNTEVAVTIPEEFKAKNVTFDFKDIKNGAKVNISSETYAGDVTLKFPNTEDNAIAEATIELPEGHVVLAQGHVTMGTVTTSPTTFVVTSGASFGTLTVNAGNVDIEAGGSVEEIAAGKENEETIIVALGEGATMPTVAEGTTVAQVGLGDVENPEQTYAIQVIGGRYYKDLALAVQSIKETGEIKIIKSYETTELVTVPNGKNITLDLNGMTITGKDNTEKNFSLIDNRGNLTIKGQGTMICEATVNSGWSRYSAVVANNPGGNLTVESGVTIEHKGGTDMAYGIDNLTNGKGTSAITTINGATIKSTYRAIRQFLNGIEATNELYVKSGTIEGVNKSVWMQDPSKNANTGKLVVEAEAKLTGDVYLSVTEGSTEWPVEISIASSVIDDDSKLQTAKLPEGYAVIEHESAYIVVSSSHIANLASLKYFRDQVNAGAISKGKTVKLVADIDLNNEQWTPAGTEKIPFNGTFDGQNHTIKNLSIVETEAKEGKAYIGFLGYANNATIKNVTFENVNLNIACLDIDHSQGHIGAVAGSLEGTSTIENVTVKGDIKVEATVTANGASRVAVVAGGNAYGNVTMKNVHVEANEGSYLKANNNVGALAGQLQGKNVFEYCSSNIDVTGTKFFAGGLIGIAAGDSQFTNCHTTGDVAITAGRAGRANDHYRVGGIAGGWADGKTKVCTLTNCSYTGKVSGTNADDSVAEPLDYAGYVGRGYTLTNCAGSKVVIDGVSYIQKYNDKFGIYTIGGVTPVFTADELIEALTNTEEYVGVILYDNINIDPASMSNAYGKTGINVLNGQTINGNGKTFKVNVGGTWDSAINTTGGTIKNLTVAQGFRGIFVNHNSTQSGKVILENVTIDGPTYTISCDQGTNNGLDAINCTINGWTSYAATIGNVTFTGCKFGQGAGYAFCRPYAPTTFINCNFDEGFEMDPHAAVTLENCTLNGVKLTAENLATLVTSNIANATVK